jgi:hypothetical protein
VVVDERVLIDTSENVSSSDVVPDLQVEKVEERFRGWSDVDLEEKQAGGREGGTLSSAGLKSHLAVRERASV